MKQSVLMILTAIVSQSAFAQSNVIPLSAAQALTHSYQQANGMPAAFTMPKTAILQLLSNSGAAALRVYNGQHPNGAKTMVFVAADSSKNDLTNLIMDMAQPVPPFGSVMSPLIYQP